ncbi:type II secretion system minor pseudopilin GspI [Pseudomonas gingeri]|uniref:Type II secretion system protein I n=1 Tax=Pseudomonas gingeri TaxID=117681 RepID=A0A7Y7XCP5_9PSED|nr:type II secretion system minor pseudopilin GspI [Pseudomonas gingeri]NWB97331.1 type II secretion system minor pseudopilin GspI [Pseudomonas gingeri]
MKAESGFTLLEVMIALAIFALLSATVLSASQFVVQQSGTLQERLFATWLADNQLNELRLKAPPAKGRQQQRVGFDQREWRLEQVVTQASDPRLLKVEIAVRLNSGGPVLHSASAWVRTPDE